MPCICGAQTFYDRITISLERPSQYSNTVDSPRKSLSPPCQGRIAIKPRIIAEYRGTQLTKQSPLRCCSRTMIVKESDPLRLDDEMPSRSTRRYAAAVIQYSNLIRHAALMDHFLSMTTSSRGGQSLNVRPSDVR